MLEVTFKLPLRQELATEQLLHPCISVVHNELVDTDDDAFDAGIERINPSLNKAGNNIDPFLHVAAT